MRILLLFLLALLPASAAQVAVRVPMSAGEATNVSSLLVLDLLHSTNAFPTNTLALTNFLNLGPQTQIVTGPKVFNSISGTNAGLVGGIIDGASLTNSTYAGTLISLTGGIWTSGVLQDPVFTNAVNHGMPFSSPGLGNESLQIGASAEGNVDNSTAIGDGAVVNGLGGTSLGSQATVEVTAPFGVALAFKSVASGGAAVAIGTFADARNTNSMALGVNALAMHDFSLAIANDTTTTTNFQIRLGNSGHVLSVPGDANFGQRVAVGSDQFYGWPGMNRGIAFLNGSAPDAAATNSWVAYSEAGQAFYRSGATDEGAEANNRLHNRGETFTGSGTAYSLTTGSSARVDFSGNDPECPLPTAGRYQIIAKIEIVNGGTAFDEYRFKLRNFEDDLDITDSESSKSDLAANVIGQLVLVNTITVSDAKTIVLWGYNATAARGTVTSTHTSLTYERLY